MKIYRIKDEPCDINSLYRGALKELNATGENYIGTRRKGKHVIPVTVSPILKLVEEKHELGSEEDLKNIAKKIGF